MARKVGLTPHAVLTAAASLADQEGLESVTLANVAARLGVRSPSLYAHIDGLAALRRTLGLQAAAQMAGELRTARRGLRGAAALAAVAQAYLAFARAHPGWYEAIHASPTSNQDTESYRALASLVMSVVECLGEMGVPPGEMIHQTRVVRSALHGFVSLERSNGFGRPSDFDQSYDRLIRTLVSGVGVGGRQA